ncbi:MAG: PEGA domain-containing protein [Planctomycetes bacterium]|nr:PEGA domain-containing protein [Planctomycetota bacterium]
MTSGRTLRTVAALGILACAGCVDRRFIIESNVPNAQVYIDDQAIGAAPAHTSFEYYGHYTVTIVQPGFETLKERIHVGAPWYAYPPIDFLAEVVWPFHIRDTRRYFFTLHEASKTRTDTLLNEAEALRLRGASLPSPERPAPPKGKQVPLPPLPPQPGPDGQPFPQPGNGGILPPPRPEPPLPDVVPRVGP